jgi:hypothetical protein
LSSNGQTSWRIAGEQIANCNCVWACPCQFNADPNTGHCEAVVTWDIQEGNFGETPLDGVRYTRLYHWPGAIHEGNGTRQMIVDEKATPEQREAVEAMESGEHGGGYFEIFANVCPNRRDTVYAPIEFELDRERRRASVRVGDIAESRAEPIKNPVSGEEHRVRIDLPNGFEYKQAEVANTVNGRASAEEPLSFAWENTYAQLNTFDWSNA